jgi:protoheme IX farnesyltransferase
MEVEDDKKMIRTQNRPLVNGQIPMSMAKFFSFLSFISGIKILFTLNPTTGTLGACTFVSYLIYTSMKKNSELCTLIGAIVGGLPPVMGYVTAYGNISDPLSFALFSVFFIWQLHHFSALGLKNKDDYIRAKMKIQSTVDKFYDKSISSAFTFPVFLALLTSYGLYSDYLPPISANLLGIVTGLSSFAAILLSANPLSYNILFYSSIISLLLISLFAVVYGWETNLKNEDLLKTE